MSAGAFDPKTWDPTKPRTLDPNQPLGHGGDRNSPLFKRARTTGPDAATVSRLKLLDADPDEWMRSTTLSEARRVYTAAKAQAALQRLRLRDPEWVHLSHISTVLERTLANLRGRLLVLPGVIADRANPEDAQHAEEVMTAAINALLSEIHKEVTAKAAESRCPT